MIHNQGKNLPTILAAYKSQSIQPDEYIFVLDRCTDNSEELLIEFSINNNVIIKKNYNGLQFQAGYCRDLGLEECNEHVLFLDGDCVPSINLFEQVSKYLHSEESTLVIAKRINMCEDGINSTPDIRETTPWFIGKVLNNGSTTIIQHKELARVSLITWSCCLGLNKSAINNIKQINSQMGYYGRLFPSVFDGAWGGEDDYIGHVSMFLDINMVALSTEHNVVHLWHPSRINDEYRIKSNEVYFKLKNLAIKNNLKGLRYSDVDIEHVVNSYVELNRVYNLHPFDD